MTLRFVLMVGLATVVSCASTRVEVEPEPEDLGPFWRRAAPLPTPRDGIGIAALASKVYVVGGRSGDGAVSALVDIYDPALDRWSPGPALPQPLDHAAVVTAGGVLYAIGGFSGEVSEPVATVYALGPDDRSWRIREPLPRARGGAAAAAFDGEIYVFGGLAPDEPAIRNVDRYDPSDDRWDPLPPLPTPRAGLSAARVGNVIYVLGGRTSPRSREQGTVEGFHTGTLRWERLPPMGTPRAEFATVVLGNRIHTLGGAAGAGPLDDHEAFDPRTRTWRSDTRLPTARSGLAAAVVGGTTYIIGGSEGPGGGSTGVNEVFRRE
jgi:N-acetylneuraminic acid mutarotase